MLNLPYASRSSRFLGQVLDGLVGAAPLIAVVLVGESFGDGLGAVLLIAALAWSAYYYFFADGFTGGQSIGKRWLDMHVIDAKSGTPCTYGQSFIRNLLLAILGPIDWIFIFGSQHQRLGDKIAGTVVITE